MPKTPILPTTYRERRSGLERTTRGLVSRDSGRSCVDATCTQPRESARAQIAAAVPELLRGRVAPTPQRILPRYAHGVIELGTEKKIGHMSQRTVFSVPPKAELHADVEPVGGKVLVAFVYRDNGEDVVKRAFVPEFALIEESSTF